MKGRKREGMEKKNMTKRSGGQGGDDGRNKM